MLTQFLYHWATNPIGKRIILKNVYVFFLINNNTNAHKNSNACFIVLPQSSPIEFAAASRHIRNSNSPSLMVRWEKNKSTYYMFIIMDGLAVALGIWDLMEFQILINLVITVT